MPCWPKNLLLTHNPQELLFFFQSWLVIIAAHSGKKGCTFEYTTMTNLRFKSVCHDIFWHVTNVVLVAGYQISTWQQIGLTWGCISTYTSSTAQGGGGSFKNRKPIGEVGCCESGMAERSHWWTERCLISLILSLSLALSLSLSLFLWLSTYLPTYRSIYLSPSIYLCICQAIYISIYLSISSAQLALRPPF